MNSFYILIIIVLYYATSIYMAIQFNSFNLISFYIILFFILLACYLTYILLNPTEILYPYNLLIENLYEKKVFYTDIEKQEIFPTSKILEENWKKIRQEFESLNVLNNNIGKKFINQDKDFWKGWTTFELRSFDKDNEKNMKQCPTLANILKNDSNISTAFFSILEPGKTIPSHYGPFKGILRYHLGISVPPKESGDCFISVDGETYDWQDGKGVLFNESYKHFVKNDTPYYRVILFLDVRRPVYFPMLNNFLLYLMSISPYNH